MGPRTQRATSQTPKKPQSCPNLQKVFAQRVEPASGMICVTTIAIIINFHYFCHSRIAFFLPLPPWSSWLSTSSSQSKPLSSFSQSAPTVSVSRARETISRKKEEKVGEQILKSSFLYFYKLSTTTLFISQVQTLNFGDVLFGSSRWMHLSTIKHKTKDFGKRQHHIPCFVNLRKAFYFPSQFVRNCKLLHCKNVFFVEVAANGEEGGKPQPAAGETGFNFNFWKCLIL